MRLLWSCSLTLLLFSAPVLAQQGTDPIDKKVDCSKGQSISSAVSNLEADKNYVVHVSGTCDENVAISGFEGISLVILGDPTATVNGVAATPGMPVFFLSNSRRVVLVNLTINTTGGTSPSANPVGVAMTLCRGCQVANSTINTDRVGMTLADSQGNISGTTINANTAPATGLLVFSASDANVVNFHAHGTNKSGVGLSVDQSSRVRLSSSTPTSFSIDDFGIGISVRNAGSLEAGTVCPVTPPPPPSDPTTCMDVHDNSTAVFIQSAQAFFAGLNATSNGQGIFVGNAGTLMLSGPSNITGSTGLGAASYGLLVTHNSHALIQGAPSSINSISGNDGRGVAVASNSSVEFLGAPGSTTVTGNDGVLDDVACDATSLITGTSSFTANGGIASCATTDPLSIPIP